MRTVWAGSAESQCTRGLTRLRPSRKTPRKTDSAKKANIHRDARDGPAGEVDREDRRPETGHPLVALALRVASSEYGKATVRPRYATLRELETVDQNVVFQRSPLCERDCGRFANETLTSGQVEGRACGSKQPSDLGNAAFGVLQILDRLLGRHRAEPKALPLE
jgi:hypothetical protein